MKREELIPAIIEGLITNGKKMFLDVNIDCTYEEIAEIIADEILSLSPAAEGEAQRCPVCGGNGIVPNGFYNQTSWSWSTSGIAPEVCRSCQGTGIVWG